MNGKNIFFGVLATLGIYKAAGMVRKAGNIQSNISVSVTPEDFTFISVNQAKSNLTASLTNYSGFNITVKNLFTKMNIIGNSGDVTEVGISSVNPSISFKNNETKAFPIAFNIAYLTIVGKLLAGSVKQIQIITYYDFGGQQLTYKTDVPLSEFIASAKRYITSSSKTVGGVGML